MVKMRATGWLVAAVLAVLTTGTAAAAVPWRELEPGLELVRFDVPTRLADADGDLVILRVDPELWSLGVHSTGAGDESKGRDAWAWCLERGLVAAVNAGMFQEDHRTHVGYSKIDGQVTNQFANDYLSAAAMDPVDSGDPPFRIFDLDEINLGEVAARYRTVIQNLRLIKRAGQNRWQPSRESWREVALGEDFKGRCLLIYCDTKMSMHDFNDLLLSLPVGLVAAQHLEGGGPAKLWIDHPAVSRDSLPGGHNPGPVLPNILGVARRHPQSSEQ